MKVTLKHIAEKEMLEAFAGGEQFQEMVFALLDQQKFVWQLASKNYRSLKKMRIRTLDVDNVKIYLQYNAERIKSTSAKVDEKSISERPCFLCEENLPSMQVGVPFKDKFLITVNPYPIFHHHFTIPLMGHSEQAIGPYFRDMLDLAEQLPCLTIFYNGPKCGASAPDHFHFQAVTTGILPVERDATKQDYTEPFFVSDKIDISVFKHYLRNGVILKSPWADEVEMAFAALMDALPNKDNGEPMVNVIVTHNEDQWQVIVMPRDKHRPDFYYSSHEDNLLLSPAAVDMGGICILPREEDFEKATPEMIRQAFMEVTRSDIGFDSDLKRFSNRLKTIWP
jgi:hypothetical protein